MCVFFSYHVGVSCFIRYLDIVKSNVQEPVPPFMFVVSKLGRMWVELWKIWEKTRRSRTNWSTDFSTPVIRRSFFSSTMTVWSVRVLKTEKISCH